MNWGAGPPGIPYRNHHLRRAEIDMDDLRGSFSRFKKDIKHRFRGRKRAPDEVTANTTVERADPSASLLRSDSRPLASGHGGEGTRTSTDALQAHLRDISPRPEPIPAREGHNDPHGREVEVGEKEVTQHPDPEPDAEVAVGSGPGHRVHPSPFPLSLSHKAEPDSG